MEKIRAKRYIIWAQPLTRSAGTRVLYMLYERLRQRGQEALIYCPVEHLDRYEYIDILDAATLAHDIVVYPEIVWGNPLRFQNVVRYVLYVPGVLAGEATYHPGECLFTWSLEYCDTNELFWSTIDRSLFFDEQLPKTQDCYFVNKVEKWGDFAELRDAIEINMSYPATREELAQLLKTTRILYNFDEYSILSEEALLCGAQVKIVTKDGMLDFKPFFPGSVIDKSCEESLMASFISITQDINYTGPLQEEEPFFHHYTGIFYHAAARCATLGAWEEALDYCRKAYLGKPLEKPALNLPQELDNKTEQEVSTTDPDTSDTKNTLTLVLKHASAGRFMDAAQIILPLIANEVGTGNRPVAASYMVLLAQCYEGAGLPDEAAEAERLALLSDPAHPVAAHMAVLRSLAEGKTNQALFTIIRLLAPYLARLDMVKALPGLALLGLIVAGQPDKTAALARRLPEMLTATQNHSPQLTSNAALREWRKALADTPLGQKILRSLTYE